jgi:DNA-binding transcriptional LysR family regulator
VVSQSGEAHGFVDDALARLGYRRRIAPTVSSFLQALAVLGETDLIAVLPRRPLLAHARAFGLASIDPPFPVPRDPIRLVATDAALMDAGMSWLFDLLQSVHAAEPRRQRAARRGRARARAVRVPG